MKICESLIHYEKISLKFNLSNLISIGVILGGLWINQLINVLLKSFARSGDVRAFVIARFHCDFFHRNTIDWIVHLYNDQRTPPKINTSQKKHGTWKWTLGKGDFYWKPSFPGSMLIFGGVTHPQKRDQDIAGHESSSNHQFSGDMVVFRGYYVQLTRANNDAAGLVEIAADENPKTLAKVSVDKGTWRSHKDTS